MTFDSFIFFVFLLVTFTVYWLLRDSRMGQNRWLLVCSYVFYGWWNVSYLSLIVFTTTISWWCGLRIHQERATERTQRLYNTLNIVVNLLVLAIFKYYNFFVDASVSVAASMGFVLDWPTLHLLLPIGISFYTFQALSYTIDVRRGMIEAERSWPTYAAYLSFFPQLVAGPIERAKDLLPQFHHSRHFDYPLAADGCRQMLWGFFKKIAVANACAETVGMIFDDYATADSLTLWYGAGLFAVQIYADFSGYSDIAIGCAKLFGFRLSRNFSYPYMAINIPDVWRKWHISLTSWFRDYVYIPLGGSRQGRWRTLLNTLIVFSLSGLWHGADWHFMAWGFYHGLLFLPYCLEWTDKRWTPKGRWTRLGSQAITLVQVVIGWIIFRSPSLATAWDYVLRLFTTGIEGLPPYSKNMLVPICLLFLIEWWHKDCSHGLQLEEHCTKRWMRVLIYYGLIVMMLWYAGASAQFIYFQF